MLRKCLAIDPGPNHFSKCHILPLGVEKKIKALTAFNESFLHGRMRNDAK